jgi:hypothetical protein
MSKIAATVRTADRVDYWIRRHVISYCDGSYPSQRKVNSARDKRVVLSAIGKCLKDEYDALATPIPPHLAALVKQLETQNRRPRNRNRRPRKSRVSRMAKNFDRSNLATLP